MQYTISHKMANMKPSAVREILKYSADPAVIPFSAGNPAPEAFPIGRIQEVTADILAKNPIGALQYSVSEGYQPLRELLVKNLKAEQQIGREFDNLIIVSGAQQAADLATKTLCNEGDVVLCEDPSFIGCLNTFRSYGVNLIGVPMEEDGISLTALEETIKREKNVRFLYTIPNFQNPTGITMALSKRKAVYDICKKYDVLIFEDNPYGDLRFAGEGLPTIKSMDEDGLVLYCGSFSKILAPGLRVGYLMAPMEVASKIIVAKQCSDVHTTILSQLICYEYLTRYDMKEHIARLQEIYRKKCTLMLGEMDRQMSKALTYTRPEGGLFLWCTLPEGADMPAFCAEAVKVHKVAVVPGSAFLADPAAPTQAVRINYSTPTDEQIVKGIGILGEMSRKLFG